MAFAEDTDTLIAAKSEKLMSNTGVAQEMGANLLDVASAEWPAGRGNHQFSLFIDPVENWQWVNKSTKIKWMHSAGTSVHLLVECYVRNFREAICQMKQF